MGRWGLFRVIEIPDHDDPTKVYLKRYALIKTPFFGVKVHHIRMSDRPETRGLHDHPWSFIAFRLRRGYKEWVPSRVYNGVFDTPPDGLRRPTGPAGWIAYVFDQRRHRFVNIVRATDLHAVCLDDEVRGCWTLVLSGRRKREWGFRFPGEEWKPWYESDGPVARNKRGEPAQVRFRPPKEKP